MSSPNITFMEVPDGIRKPGKYAEFKLNAGIMALPANDQSVVILAQKIATPAAWLATTAYTVGDAVRPVTANGHYYVCVVAGTTGAAEPTWPTASTGEVTDGTVTWREYIASGSLVAELTPTKIYSPDEAAAYAGAGSIAHMMARAAFAANRRIDVTICTIDDSGTGVAATGSWALSGTASSSGTLTVWIGNERIAIAIASADTAAEIAAALEDAVAEKEHILPVVASVVSGTLTLTAKNAGTLGNQIHLDYECTASGITVVQTDMASGANDPDISATDGLLDKLFPADYDIYADSFNDATSLGYMKTHIDNISDGVEKRPATCYIGATDLTGTISEVKTLCGGGASPTLNHWRTSCGYLPSTRSISYEIAAAYAAVKAYEDDPAQPLNDYVLAGIHAPAIADRLGNTEIEDLLENGVTPLHVISGERVAIVRAISTYTKNDQGVDDPTLLDITKACSLDYTRKAFVQRMTTKFPAPKFTDRVKNAMLDEGYLLLEQLETLEIVKDVEYWKDYLIIETDSQDLTRANMRIPADVVEGLHVLAMRIDLL